MSKKAKIAFLSAFLSLVAALVVQVMTGVWLNLNSALLGLAGALVALAILFDWKLYWEFFTMRTTKHGMNMGALIVMVITLLVCLNYLANKHNKTWDVTQEKLNSLSEQTTKLLTGLNKDLEVKVFFQGPSGRDEKQRVKQTLSHYQDQSIKVKDRFINAYIEQQEAIRYLSDQSDRGSAPVVVFAEYGGKKVRIEEPFDESAVTSALIRVTREGESKIYFVQGHGERDLNGDEDQGLKELAKALGEASFKVEPLPLIDKKEIPADAALVAIVGPSVPYLDSELQWLRDYMKKGGRLFLAVDPGQRHNLANLTKPLGVEFENNYVLTMAPIVGGGPATVLGRTFDSGSDITKSIPNGAAFAVFPIVSEVKIAPDKAADIQAEELVKTDGFAFTMLDPTKPLTEKPQTKVVSLAVDVKGSLEKPEAKEGESQTSSAKAFEAVIFGDSDFLTNRGLMMGVNRDLAMNAIAQLANQKDLISIRPKLPKGSMLTLTSIQRLITLIAGLGLPVVLLILSGVMWYRRRGA